MGKEEQTPNPGCILLLAAIFSFTLYAWLSVVPSVWKAITEESLVSYLSLNTWFLLLLALLFGGTYYLAYHISRLRIAVSWPSNRYLLGVLIAYLLYQGVACGVIWAKGGPGPYRDVIALLCQCPLAYGVASLVKYGDPCPGGPHMIADQDACYAFYAILTIYSFAFVYGLWAAGEGLARLRRDRSEGEGQVSWNCPECGKQCHTDGRYRGRTVECRGCGEYIKVPERPGASEPKKTR